MLYSISSCHVAYIRTMPHWSIYILWPTSINSGHLVTLTCLQLRKLTFRGHQIHIATRIDEWNMIVVKVLLCLCLIRSLVFTCWWLIHHTIIKSIAPTKKRVRSYMHFLSTNHTHCHSRLGFFHISTPRGSFGEYGPRVPAYSEKNVLLKKKKFVRACTGFLTLYSHFLQLLYFFRYHRFWVKMTH